MTATLEELLGGIETSNPTEKALSKQTMLVFGDAGTGKTTLVSKFPNHLFIDTEDGSKNREISAAKNKVRSWARFKAIVDSIYDNPSQLMFDTMIVDTIDGLYALCVKHCHAEMRAAGEDPETAKYGRKYTVPREEFEGVLGKLFQLHADDHMGCVFTAHEHREEIVTPTRTITKFRPQINDKFWREEFPKRVQLVLWARRLDQHPLTQERWDRQHFLLQTKVMDVDTVVKDRTERLPPLLPMSYDALEQAYNNTETGEQEQ